jgi:HSP20 family protein
MYSNCLPKTRNFEYENLNNFLKANGIAERTFQPAADIVEAEKAFFIYLDVPGLEKKDLNLSVEKNVLTISGERKKDLEIAEDKYVRFERYYGKFSRSFRLSQSVTTEDIKASFNNGQLTIEIPKAEETKAKTIEIA